MNLKHLIKQKRSEYPKRMKTLLRIKISRVLGIIAALPVLGIFIGIIITTAFVQLEISPQWVTDQTCDAMIENASIYAKWAGAVDVANYTTLTGNFTYINNNTLQTQSVEEYCYGMIQQLNEMGVNQNG